MKSLMITGPSSNSGKTIVTLGLLRAIKNKGIDISAFKTGPDFIDSKYLSLASKKTSGNLDIHMMGIKGLKDSLSLNQGEYGLIEGAMGYFDGISNTFENSSYHISKELNIPTILIYSPKGEMFSAIPKIKGMVDFSESNIKGIILNKVSKSIYEMLKPQIEEYIGVKVLGYIPLDNRLNLENRSLGLTDESLLEKDEFIELVSFLVEETIDINMLLNIAKDIEIDEYIYPKKRDIKVGVAMDEAFNFYYSENLKLFENICEVCYFSPLEDDKLPDVDLIYIGGGYPELYIRELFLNENIKKSIKDYVENQGYILAEGGGLMYLMEYLENKEMVGIFPGKSYMTSSLDKFGYVDMKGKVDNLYGEKDIFIKGNEYHKSKIDIDMECVFSISKPKSKKSWECGYSYKNVLAYFQHINFLGNMNILNNLLDEIEKGDR